MRSQRPAQLFQPPLGLSLVRTSRGHGRLRLLFSASSVRRCGHTALFPACPDYCARRVPAFTPANKRRSTTFHVRRHSRASARCPSHAGARSRSAAQTAATAIAGSNIHRVGRGHRLALLGVCGRRIRGVDTPHPLQRIQALVVADSDTFVGAAPLLSRQEIVPTANHSDTLGPDWRRFDSHRQYVAEFDRSGHGHLALVVVAGDWPGSGIHLPGSGQRSVARVTSQSQRRATLDCYWSAVAAWSFHLGQPGRGRHPGLAGLALREELGGCGEYGRRGR